MPDGGLQRPRLYIKTPKIIKYKSCSTERLHCVPRGYFNKNKMYNVIVAFIFCLAAFATASPIGSVKKIVPDKYNVKTCKKTM